MRALSERVDTGVGPSGAMDPKAYSRYPVQRALELILDSLAVRLTLPAGKRGPVVGDG